MIRKILQIWKKVGMDLYWGDLLDSRFYVAQLIHDNKKDIILDLGCGAGVMLHISQANLKIGLELGKKSILKAKNLEPNMQIICGDLRYLPFRDNFFNNIIAIHSISSLQNIKDRMIAYREIKRISSLKQTELIISAANRRSKHYYKNTSREVASSFIHYKEVLDFFKSDFDFSVEGYHPFCNFWLYPLKKLILKLPESRFIENLIYRFLKSKRYLRDGRSFVMICKRTKTKPQKVT